MIEYIKRISWKLRRRLTIEISKKLNLGSNLFNHGKSGNSDLRDVRNVINLNYFVSSPAAAQEETAAPGEPATDAAVTNGDTAKTEMPDE